MAFITFNYFSSCLKRTVTANAIIPADKTMTFGRFGKKKEFKMLSNVLYDVAQCKQK